MRVVNVGLGSRYECNRRVRGNTLCGCSCLDFATYDEKKDVSRLWQLGCPRCSSGFNSTSANRKVACKPNGFNVTNVKVLALKRQGGQGLHAGQITSVYDYDSKPADDFRQKMSEKNNEPSCHLGIFISSLSAAQGSNGDD